MERKSSFGYNIYMIYGLRMHVPDNWLQRYENSYMGGAESVMIK